MMEENEGDDDFEKEIMGRKMNFMVNDTFMNLSIQDLLEQLKLSTETTIEVYYLFALDKPKPR